METWKPEELASISREGDAKIELNASATVDVISGKTEDGILPDDVISMETGVDDTVGVVLVVDR